MELQSLYWRVAALVLAYGAATAITYMAIPSPSLTDVVNAFELVSLLVLIIVNGDISQEVNSGTPLLRKLNRCILGISSVLFFLLFLEVLSIPAVSTTGRSWLQHVLNLLENNIYWLSSFPLVAYAALDFYSAYGRPKSSISGLAASVDSSVLAKRFIAFVDLACVFPLMLVLAFTLFHQEADPSNQLDVRLFVSGSMAVVLVASSVAAKAVEITSKAEQY